MTRVTKTQILCRAIEHCTAELQEVHADVAEWRRMGREDTADFVWAKIYTPLEEELDVLKQMYEIETGSPYA